MKPEEEFFEGDSMMEEDPLFAPDDSADSVKPNTVQGFKLWWDGWE